MRVLLIIVMLLQTTYSAAISKETVEGLSPFIREVMVKGRWGEDDVYGYYRFVVTVLDKGGFDNYQYQLFVQWINDDSHKSIATVEISELVDERYLFSLPECKSTKCTEFTIQAISMESITHKTVFTVKLLGIGRYSVHKN